MPKLFQKMGVAILTGLLSVAISLAQANCPSIVEEALNAVDENCDAIGRNEACYGYDQVEASFLVSVEDDFFSEVSSLAPVMDIETLRTAPLDEETGVWGVAVMNLQANLPNTLPGQSVTFVLLGDAEIENAVDPEEAFVPSEGVEVSVNVATGANVRSGAGTNFNVVGGVRNGETLLADGLSQDGEWLRVAYRNRPAWISRTVINDSNPALRDLPTLSSDLRTPMQAFYLRTGIGQPACEEAPPDGLLVQGPENIEISLNVNGADIRLGSSGYLRVLEVEDEFFLEILVFDGEFKVGDVTIRRGERSLLCLGDEGSRGLDGEDNDLVVTCDPSIPENIEMGEWCVLENMPSDILNYGLDVPCPGETSAPTTGGGGASQSQIAEVNCRNFNITTTQIIATALTLSWTAATGADNYEIAIFDNTGFQVSLHNTSATSIGLNGGTDFPPSGYVDVRAYRGGQYACFARLNFVRGADPNERPAEDAPFSYQLTCSGSTTVIVTWYNLAAGDSLTIVWDGTTSGSQGGFTSATGSFDTNSQFLNPGYPESYLVVNPAGTIYNLAGFSC